MALAGKYKDKKRQYSELFTRLVITIFYKILLLYINMLMSQAKYPANAICSMEIKGLLQCFSTLRNFPH